MILEKRILVLVRWRYWWVKVYFIREVKRNIRLGWFEEKMGGEEVGIVSTDNVLVFYEGE